MTKAELVETIAIKRGVTKKLTVEFLDTVFEEIAAAVKKEGRFSYPGFGTWSVRKRKARTIRNPQTRELMQLPESFTIGFRLAKEQKDTVRVDPKALAQMEASEADARARRDALEKEDRNERSFARYEIDEVLG